MSLARRWILPLGGALLGLFAAAPAEAGPAAFPSGASAAAGRTDVGGFVGLQEWVVEVGAAIRHRVSSEDELGARLSLLTENVPDVSPAKTGLNLGGDLYTRLVPATPAWPLDMGPVVSGDGAFFDGLDLLHLDVPWMIAYRVSPLPLTLDAGAGLFATYALGPFSRGDLGPLALAGVSFEAAGFTTAVDFRLRVGDDFWPVEVFRLSLSLRL